MVSLSCHSCWRVGPDMKAMTEKERLLTMFARNTATHSLKRLGQFEDNENDAEAVLEVPEDLTALSSDDLAGLLSQASEAFTNLYGDGSAEFSDDELETLEGLTGAIESLRAEKDARAEAAQERARKAADFAVRVNGETVSEDDAKDVDITTEEAETSDSADDSES